VLTFEIQTDVGLMKNVDFNHALRLPDMHNCGLLYVGRYNPIQSNPVLSLYAWHPGSYKVTLHTAGECFHLPNSH